MTVYFPPLVSEWAVHAAILVRTNRVFCPPYYCSLINVFVGSWLNLSNSSTGSVEGCTCWRDDICRNSEIYLNNAKRCPKCDSDLDCPAIEKCNTYTFNGVKGSLCSGCRKPVDEKAGMACMRSCKASQTGKQCKQIPCSEAFYGSAAGTDTALDRGGCVCRCCNGVRYC